MSLSHSSVVALLRAALLLAVFASFQWKSSVAQLPLLLAIGLWFTEGSLMAGQNASWEAIGKALLSPVVLPFYGFMLAALTYLGSITAAPPDMHAFEKPTVQAGCGAGCGSSSGGGCGTGGCGSGGGGCGSGCGAGRSASTAASRPIPAPVIPPGIAKPASTGTITLPPKAANMIQAGKAKALPAKVPMIPPVAK